MRVSTPKYPPGTRIKANIKKIISDKVVDSNYAKEKNTVFSALQRAFTRQTVFTSYLMLFAVEQDREGILPCSRYLAASCVSNKHVFLFGGLSTTKLNDIWYMDKDTEFHWKKMKMQYDPMKMHSHTINFFNGQLFAFGGVSDDLTRDELTVVNLSA